MEVFKIIKLFNEFFSVYGSIILYTILTTVIGYISAKLKYVYYINTKKQIKRSVVRNVVAAVEQIYSNLNNNEKFEVSKKYIVEILSEKNIKITDLEIKVLIEETYNSFMIVKVGAKSE